MTANEKRFLVNRYCLNHDCNHCNLHNKWIRDYGDGCITISCATEEELDWAVELIGEAAGEDNADSDSVNHPSHYQGKHECIDEMVALFGVEAVKHFCMCNVHKYRYRAANKNGQEDLDKADWYMDKLMELEGIKDAEN